MSHPRDRPRPKIAEGGGPATNDSRLQHRETAHQDDVHDAFTVASGSSAPEPPSHDDPLLDRAKYFFGDRNPALVTLVYLVVVLIFVLVLALGLALILVPHLGTWAAGGVGLSSVAAGTGAVAWRRRQRRRRRRTRTSTRR